MPNTGSSRQQSTFTLIVPPKVHRKSAAAAIVTCAAALAALFGALEGYAHWYETAVIVLMVAATATVGIRTSMNAEVLERVRQDGYDDGYEAGRRVAKPVLVKLASFPDAARDLGE